MDDEDEELTGIAGLYKPLKKENHEHRMQGNKSVLGIFSKRYLCSFNDMQTRHPDELRTFGVRLSGNEVIDRQQRNANITTYITIATMAHYVRMGVAVRIMNYNDSKVIYETISDHIRGWKENYTFSLNKNNVPIEDLQALENLSIKVFPSAKSVMTKEGKVKDYFDKAMEQFNLTSSRSLFVRDDFNKKYKITDKTDPNKNSHIEIIRDDNNDYILDLLSKSGGGLNGL